MEGYLNVRFGDPEIIVRRCALPQITINESREQRPFEDDHGDGVQQIEETKQRLLHAQIGSHALQVDLHIVWVHAVEQPNQATSRVKNALCPPQISPLIALECSLNALAPEQHRPIFGGARAL